VSADTDTTTEAASLTTGDTPDELTTTAAESTATGEARAVESMASRPVMPVTALTGHPGNVRQDLSISRDFQASVAAGGVLIPLRVTPAADGAWRVIDGHRRLAAAIAAGLTEVPVDVVADRARDEAAQYLDMAIAGRHQVPLTTLEQANALFAAGEAGATRTRIRRATGLTKAGVAAALAASTLEPATRNAVASLPGQLDFDQLAILAEFRDDHVALTRLITSARTGQIEHQAELLRRERAEREESERLRVELTAAGYAVTDGSMASGGKLLQMLAHDGETLTPEAHTTCPGRAVYFRSWDPASPVHYCADPSAGGHTEPDTTRPLGAAGAGGVQPPAGQPQPGERDASRRLVIDGNRAWRAAIEVRRRWVTSSLLSRTAAPREAAPFIAGQLLAMPEPLRSGLASAAGSDLLAQLAGQEARHLTEISVTARPGRLTLLMLAPIVTAYETALANVLTWRTGPHFMCPRDSAGAYLAFLARTGYHLSAIEQAVADGDPYTGEPAGDDLDADNAAGADDSATDGDPDEGATTAGPGNRGDDGDLADDGADHRGDDNAPAIAADPDSASDRPFAA
jgi:ParB family chromosome partitioning protein